MLKIAFLLIGPAAFRSQWHVLAIAGALLMAVAAALIAGVSPILTVSVYLAIGISLLGVGIVLALGELRVPTDSRRGFTIVNGVTCVAVGTLILISVLIDGWMVATAILVGLAMGLVGLNRFAAAFVFKVGAWRLSALYGAAELALAAMILASWPLSAARMAPVGVGLVLAVSGWILLRVGLMLRTLEEEAAILLLPVFSRRGWYDHAPILVNDTGSAPQRHEKPMTLYIWTPEGAAGAPVERLPVINRYVVAFARNGTVSTGHVSLELLPDLYISHYPGRDLGQPGDNLLSLLNSGRENDMEGRFLPSYPEEVADWCPSEVQISLHTYSERRLRAFWAGYRQDSTYNLSNRNCSTLVVAALDAALEGALASPRPWRRLMALLLEPDMWAASAIRSRATAMSWTPGFLLDYASALRRLVDEPQRSWPQRLKRILRLA
ncbi:MAG: hypothetical protein KIS62_06980 [Ramlibacter sp.]|nr:hypothetical protein [Ramlibacter sp.]